MAAPFADPCYQELPLGTLDRARVEALWRYEPRQAGHQKVLPDGRMDLLAHCHVASTGRLASMRLVIAGPADRPSLVAVQPEVVALGIRFHIGWGGACLGVQPSALLNRNLVGETVERLLGPLAGTLMRAEPLHDAQARLHEIAATLAARARLARAHLRALAAIDALKRQVQGASANEVACMASARTLRRDVAVVAGLPLRTLAGVLRFQHAMDIRERGASSLTELAVAAGYADQAHMTRAFRRFGGFTPALPEPVPIVRLQQNALP